MNTLFGFDLGRVEIYIWILVIPMVLMLAWLVYLLVKFLLTKSMDAQAHKAFCEEFSFDNRDKRIKVHWRTATGLTSFSLKYPAWAVPNKDATRDKRVRSNKIIWRESVLYISKYAVTTKRPDDMLDIVYRLRCQNISIPMCQEERYKYYSLIENRQVSNSFADINNLVKHFEMHPTEFENLCAEAFRRLGYIASVTQATNDGGYDIILQKDYRVSLVECKCYSPSHKVGRPSIQKLVGANVVEKADELIFITTSDFSSSAIAYAKECNVHLINGTQLLEILNSAGIINQHKVEVHPGEWYLDVRDLEPSIPKDIFASYFSG